tara:strand:+ start:8174 stop:8815 length:642 start_codon:yes stop_codon:yes gene_type:complete
MATRKSTNINELPSLNSLANQTDEDDAIAEVLEEIENENNATNNSPSPPMETMPQGPSMNNIPKPMPHPMQNPMQNQMPNPQMQHPQMQQMRQRPMRVISQQVPMMATMPAPQLDQNSIQQNVLDQLKTHLLTENFVDKKQKEYDNRALKFIDDMKTNTSLISIIFISYMMLQNDTIKKVLLSRFENFNIPYLNVVILAVVQVLLVFVFKNVF